jgi:hypothetical protein
MLTWSNLRPRGTRVPYKLWEREYLDKIKSIIFRWRKYIAPMKNLGSSINRTCERGNFLSLSPRFHLHDRNDDDSALDVYKSVSGARPEVDDAHALGWDLGKNIGTYSRRKQLFACSLTSCLSDRSGCPTCDVRDTDLKLHPQPGIRRIFAGERKIKGVINGRELSWSSEWLAVRLRAHLICFTQIEKPELEHFTNLRQCTLNSNSLACKIARKPAIMNCMIERTAVLQSGYLNHCNQHR